MINDNIKAKFDEFFVFDTDDRSIVTSTSAILFADSIQSAERRRCIAILSPTAQDIRLMAGEMLPGEIRTVQAVLRELAKKVENGI
jgi:hypothetical protein